MNWRKISAISPFVAKIEEFRETGFVDYNVTMEHLRDYFEKNGVKLPDVKIFSELEYEYEFDKKLNLNDYIRTWLSLMP